MKMHSSHDTARSQPWLARLGLGCAVALGSLGVGCASAEPPPARSGGTPSLPAPPPQEPRYLNVGLTADLARCETDTPHFFYDVDTPRPQDDSELSQLASCLESEPYRDLKLMLIGRADHRGDTEYNEALGRRRAQHVADVLTAHGVDRERLVVKSRGEAEAIGHTDSMASLGYDRRVDIVVLNPVTPGHPAEPVHHRDQPQSLAD